MRAFSTHFLRLLVLLVVGVVGLASRANAATVSYTLDLPLKPNVALPSWLGPIETPAGAFATVYLPLTPPEAANALLVTLTFQEKEGGFLRLAWKNGTGEQELSANLFQGTGMANQRSILIPANVIGSSGTLIIQCGDATLDVQKVDLQWLENRSSLVSLEWPDQVVVSRLGKATPASTLDGDPAGLGSPQLDGNLVTVPVVSTPQRIENGVAFSVQMDGVPRAARIFLQESGLPWNQHLVVWVNEKRAGTITPDAPDLDDPGYSTTGDAGQAYVGWRNGSIYVPVSLFKIGNNILEFSAENEDPDAADTSGDAAAGQPLAVNQVMGQFDYSTPAPATPAVPAAPVVPVTATNSVPSTMPALSISTTNAPPISPLPNSTIP